MTDDANADPTPSARAAWAVGIATFDATDGRVLDTWYPAPSLGRTEETVRLSAEVGHNGGAATYELDAVRAAAALGAEVDALTAADDLRRVRRAAVVTFVEDLDQAPVDAHDVYLRLHLLSHRLVRPRAQNLDGMFGLLTNVVWTNLGPCPVEGFEQTRLRLKVAGHHVTVFGVDKFPRMVDYVLPAGVRIAEADRVRLGSHLAEGTVVMHEGYCNFNAGTLGTAMVEGRISAGVIVGADSDIGGGASVMGTLSGGGKEVVSIGERCLVGANAGIGISLGDDCTVEAGLYVTAGTRVTQPDGQVVKAGALSGVAGLLFRRNSTTGTVEVLSKTVDWGSLNRDLHDNG